MFLQEDKELLKENMPEARLGLALEKFYNPGYFFRNDFSQLNDDKKYNATLTTAYPFSNERTGVMFNKLCKYAKSILVLGSSFDQALNGLYNGASDITLIDANLFSKYYSDYKVAAIKSVVI